MNICVISAWNFKKKLNILRPRPGGQSDQSQKQLHSAARRMFFSPAIFSDSRVINYIRRKVHLFGGNNRFMWKQEVQILRHDNKAALAPFKSLHFASALVDHQAA